MWLKSTTNNVNVKLCGKYSSKFGEVACTKEGGAIHPRWETIIDLLEIDATEETGYRTMCAWYDSLKFNIKLNHNCSDIQIRCSSNLVRWIHHDIAYSINCINWSFWVTSLHENSNCLKTCYIDDNHNIPQTTANQ